MAWQRKALSSEDSNILGRMRMFSSLEVFNVYSACNWTGFSRRNGTRSLFGRWIKGNESIGEVELSPAGRCLRNLLVFQILIKCVFTGGSKNCWRQVLISICFLGFSPPLTPFFFFFPSGKRGFFPQWANLERVLSKTKHAKARSLLPSCFKEMKNIPPFHNSLICGSLITATYLTEWAKERKHPTLNYRAVEQQI